MNHFLHGVARATVESFPLPEPILEIGSYQVPGQDDISNLRAFFPGRNYVGVDMRPGPGVDCVAEVEKLPQADASVGTVLCFNTFEHVKRFWRGFDEIQRVLRPDGVLVLSCPFYFHIHGYPHDYWRFTPTSFEFLLEDYPHKIIGWHGARLRPSNIWAVAGRPDWPGLSPTSLARYHQLLNRYAHEPVKSWTKRIRYQLGSVLCGRRPFASFLDHDRWELQANGAGLEETRLVG